MQKEPDSARSPASLVNPVGLAGQHRLVRGHAPGLDHLAVGDELVPGLDVDHVPGHNFGCQQLDHHAVAHHLRVGGDQHRQLIQGRLRLQLLADADVGVDHRDQPEQRVRVQPQRQV